MLIFNRIELQKYVFFFWGGGGGGCGQGEGAVHGDSVNIHIPKREQKQ